MKNVDETKMNKIMNYHNEPESTTKIIIIMKMQKAKCAVFFVVAVSVAVSALNVFVALALWFNAIC